MPSGSHVRYLCLQGQDPQSDSCFRRLSQLRVSGGWGSDHGVILVFPYMEYGVQICQSCYHPFSLFRRRLAHVTIIPCRPWLPIAPIKWPSRLLQASQLPPHPQLVLYSSLCASHDDDSLRTTRSHGRYVRHAQSALLDRS